MCEESYWRLEVLLNDLSRSDFLFREDIIQQRTEIKDLLAGLDLPEEGTDRYHIYERAQAEVQSIMQVIGIMSHYYGPFRDNPTKLVAIVFQEEE